MAYTKTNWQDLPNTTTPINATNLNKMEQGIYDANNKNVITIGLNADTETTSTSAYQTIDLNLTKEVGKVGTKLSLSSGEVLIGSGVTKVLVSGKMQTQNESSSYGMIIKKNNTEISNNFEGNSSSSWSQLTASPILVSVAEGDTIKMAIYHNSSGTTKTIKAYDGYGTYLTVEVID